VYNSGGIAGGIGIPKNTAVKNPITANAVAKKRECISNSGICPYSGTGGSSMECDFTNIAYSQKYLRQRKRKDAVYSPKNFKGAEFIELTDGYTAKRNHYEGKVEWGKYGLIASETFVYDSLGAEVHHYFNHESSTEILKIINHSDGNQYLLFQTELRDYGVFDLASKKSFIHVPQDENSFIWVDANYNPAYDILVATGLFAAGPTVHLLRFKNPLEETKWVDIASLIPDSYEFLDVPMVRWDGDTLVLTDAMEVDKPEGKEMMILKEVSIPWDAYISALS
jgi:hypothetical protein